MLKIAYAGLLVALLVLGWGFSRTHGFVYGHDKSGALLYTNQLQSSGANDNLNFLVGSSLFVIPLILMIASKNGKARTQTMVFTACWIVQGLLLFSLDSASIRQTIFDGKNIVLSLWICCYVAVPAVFLVLAISRHRERLNQPVE